MFNRQVYSGSSRRLVLAFDLGTTFSGISYAILDPGKVPVIHTVSRYPGQEKGDAKIPTVIYYDSLGNVVAAGAEEPPLPDDEDGATPAAEPLKLEWFKLLLRPSGTESAEGIPKPKLPPKKTIIDVYADFYRYLFNRARDYIKETHTGIGGLLWESIKDSIDFVLSHPNGWLGAQQGAMRSAAIKAGLIKDTHEGHSRITFVSEGEASLHFCIAGGRVTDEVKTDNNVMIIDAGGGTVDLSTYTFTSSAPLKVQEIAAPACVFEGSVIVRQRAENHVRAKLRNSKFRGESYITSIANEFDKTAKKRFRGSGDANIKFSHMVADRDPAVGIRHGQLKLSKEELCSFFDPGVKVIKDTIEAQRRATGSKQVKTYFLVGGYAASEYLYSEIKAHLDKDGLRLFRPDTSTGKAVAEGAVSFHIDHFVSVRVSRFTYGTSCDKLYSPWNSTHEKRRSKITTSFDGRMMMTGAFASILKKNTEVAETKEFRQSFTCQSLRPVNEKGLSMTVIAYRGLSSEPPEFLDEEQKSFSTLCNISGNLKEVPSDPREGSNGKYYVQEFSVVLSFGMTELKAQLAWDLKGVEQRSPATVVYDDDFAVTVPKE